MKSQKNIFRIFLLSLYVRCALRHKETRFAWISNVDSRKYQVGYKLQKLSRQVSVVLAGPKKNGFKALLKLKFLTAILLAVLEMAYFFIISLLLNLLYDMSCSMWVWYMTSVPLLGFWNYTVIKCPKITGAKYVLNLLFKVTGVLNPRTATDMDGTLHTDLWKSETSREIKKSF